MLCSADTSDGRHVHDYIQLIHFFNFSIFYFLISVDMSVIYIC